MKLVVAVILVLVEWNATEALGLNCKDIGIEDNYKIFTCLKQHGLYFSPTSCKEQTLGNRKFIAFSRENIGVPITLMEVTPEDSAYGHPFPNWTMQIPNVKYSFNSVVDILIDPEDKLWVLDSSQMNVRYSDDTYTDDVLTCLAYGGVPDVERYVNETQNRLLIFNLVNEVEVICSQELKIPGEWSHIYLESENMVKVESEQNYILCNDQCNCSLDDDVKSLASILNPALVRVGISVLIMTLLTVSS